MKFVGIENDVAFRKIFGNDNKKEVISISFINAVLGLSTNVGNGALYVAQNLVVKK